MRLLFIDLETTGLPITKGFDNYYPYNELSYYDTSRIVQIAALVYEKVDDDFVLIREHNYIIKPEGFEIKNSNIHGIENDTASFAGISVNDAIKNMEDDLKNSDLFIAHNVLFDRTILLSELSRHSLEAEIKYVENIPIFCTASNTKNILKLPCKRKSVYKTPKLIELYNHLFGVVPQGMHDALQDIRCTAECFFELIRRKYFKLC
jgi:DNA polymerase-3 subunit epsilon